MPRHVRQLAESGIYHVMLRGVNRDAIFLDDADFEQFLKVLGLVKQLSAGQLLAYCLMPNHVHLLIVARGEPIGAMMKRLGIRYAGWFNRKYGRVGHLFQDRFKSLPVENDPYFIELVRYVWNNPVAAGIVDDPVRYQWNSCAPHQPPGLLDDRALDALLPALSRSELLAPRQRIDLPHPGERARLSAVEAAVIVQRACGALTSAEFLAMDVGAQRQVIAELRTRSVSYAVIARITGLSPSRVRRLQVASARPGPEAGLAG